MKCKSFDCRQVTIVKELNIRNCKIDIYLILLTFTDLIFENSKFLKHF